MNLQCAVLFACIAAACGYWQTRMRIRSPENNPLLNDPRFGPVQDAWKAINKTQNDPFVLMFRSKNHEPNITCVEVEATEVSEESKTATYKRTYTQGETKKREEQTVYVKAVSQIHYQKPNVIRASSKENIPSTPVPVGTNAYIQYGDYDCNSSASTFTDPVSSQAARIAAVGRSTAISAREESEDTKLAEANNNQVAAEAGKKEKKEENAEFTDFYVVFEQPNCTILKAPSLGGGCDFWLHKQVLETVLGEAETLLATGNPGKKPEQESPTEEKAAAESRSDKDGETATKDGEDTRLKRRKAIFKSLPRACRFAFLTACGYPKDMMYDKDTCKQSEQATAESNGSS